MKKLISFFATSSSSGFKRRSSAALMRCS
uniref:Uncharacterized protein n=1 Tax=Globisporangium ultimum (strain ATCC 200006 / CBS 805.95 / DAOM BR144) TaxID=431595 RepID=K3WV67_GLOUD